MSRGKNKSKRRVKDRHHYYFPKKLYRKNRIIILSYDYHHDFHNFFMANCKYPPRDCHKGGCRFALICCYHKSFIPYGKSVVGEER